MLVNFGNLFALMYMKKHDEYRIPQQLSEVFSKIDVPKVETKSYTNTCKEFIFGTAS